MLREPVVFACYFDVLILLCFRWEFFVILMMAQSRAESTWEINNYGRYINQFPPNVIKSTRKNKRINKKICRQKIYYVQRNIYIYIYIYIYQISGTRIYIYIYIRRGHLLCKNIYISSCATSKDVPDPFSPLLPIVHHFWQVFRTTSCILTELLYVGSSWSPCFCLAMWGRAIGEHPLWARPRFSISVLHVWFV